MSDDPNDRAARLAGRWGPESVDSDDEAEQKADTIDSSGGSLEVESGVDSPDEADGDSEPSMDERELTTREMQSQMLYLPPEFHKEVDLTFEELNLRFRRERDRKLEKNKDFYTGLLRLGLERLGDVRDAELEEIEELLEV